MHRLNAGMIPPNRNTLRIAKRLLKHTSEFVDSHGFSPSANLNDLEMGGDMGFSREGEGMVNWVDVKNKLLFNFEH
jgi:hypothetical protein